MSVILKVNEMQYKGLDGNYRGVNAIAEKKIDDQIADLDAAIDEASGQIQQLVENKNAIAQTIASMAELGTDTTLSTPGMAADAAKVGELKNALKQSTGNKLIDWVDGYYVGTNGSSFNEANRVAQGTGSWRYAVIEASEGDEFTISAKGAGTPRAWAFANSSKAIISVAPASTNIENAHLIAPANTAYLVLNDQLKTKDSFYGWLLKQKESDQITGQVEAESLDYKLIKEGYIVRKFASAELKTGAIIPSNGFFDAVATAYISTPFLRIPAGCGGMITNMKVASNAYGGFAYYDINYNYISGGNNDTTGDADGIYSLFYKENIPANAKYIRICNSTALHESTNDLFVIYTSDVAFQCAHELDGNIQSVIQSEDKNGIVTIKPYFLNGCARFNNFKIYDLSVHYARTGYIKIPEKCKRIETNMYCSNTDFGICFLDENKDIISGVSLHNSNSIHDITTIPSGTVYIIASTSHLDPTDFSALDSKYIKFFQYDNTDRNKENDAYNASASIGANHEKLIFDFWKNKVLDSSSQVTDLNGYSITDEILVEDFASVTIENTVSGTDRYVVYDKDHNIVSYGGASELTTTVTLPYGSKYLLVALSFAQEATFAVYGNGKYYGKKVSIVGDSISSYDGYNPEGYAYYYPHGEVDDVSKTWWMRVINKTGMTLLRNCSWSASKVTGDSTGTAIAGCSTQRVSDLSDGINNPDVIFVYIGTNDWNHSYEIGDFDSTSDIPQEGTISVISDAYALLLYKIRTTYPNAELFCLTDLEGRTQPGDVQYPVLNTRGESIHQMNHEIIELAHIFGAKVVDLETCGIHFWNVPQYTVDGSSQYPINTNIHPNIAGMTLICDAVLKTMMY